MFTIKGHSDSDDHEDSRGFHTGKSDSGGSHDSGTTNIRTVYSASGFVKICFCFHFDLRIMIVIEDIIFMISEFEITTFILIYRNAYTGFLLALF